MAGHGSYTLFDILRIKFPRPIGDQFVLIMAVQICPKPSVIVRPKFQLDIGRILENFGIPKFFALLPATASSRQPI